MRSQQRSGSIGPSIMLTTSLPMELSPSGAYPVA